MNVIKRDGTIQEFNIKKPLVALNKVYKKSLKKEPPSELVTKFTEDLNKFVQKNNAKDVDIEIIQDFIRDFLMKKDKDAAEAFVVYRNDRDRIRENKSKLIKNVATKLYAKNIQNQNANVDEASFGGRIGEASRVVTKDYALNNCMSKMARDNHNNNYIYVHDLDSYAVGMHNCLSIPFDKLLKTGFTTKQADVRGANSINTAFQLVAVIFQLQSLQQFGGVSATHLDWTMEPYVRISFWKHYNDICDTIPFCGSRAYKENDFNIKETSIKSTKYWGVKWYSFIRKYIARKATNRTVKELNQAVEGMYHNLNTLQSRSGNQLPFTSINYGTCTSPEGRMVIKSLIEGCIKGVGKYHKTSIFPCGIFQWMKGVNNKKGTPNYDLYRLALKSTAKRIYPNYANNNWSNNEQWIEYDRQIKRDVISSLSYEDYLILALRVKEYPEIAKALYLTCNEFDTLFIDNVARPEEYFSTMGCRTANGADINFKEVYERNIRSFIDNKKLICDDLLSAAQKDGRGNICPVTIIMPKIAMETKLAMDKKFVDEDPLANEAVRHSHIIGTFLDNLDKKIDEAKDMLIERFNWICSQSPASAQFMYENGTMAGYIPEEGIVSALKHGTLAIGQIGLAETLQILMGCDHTDPAGMEVAIQIEKLFNQRCTEFKKQYHLNFGVYLTPAENLCFTAMKKFKAEYGEIPNISDKSYFTNSIHVPVWSNVDCFEKINIESKLTGFSNAGCITYVELPSTAINNIDACEEITNHMMENDIPYGAENFPLDYCKDCHTQGDFNGVCPECGSTNIEELRRVTGYLSTSKKHFNLGKQDETDDRVKHDNKELFKLLK